MTAAKGRGGRRPSMFEVAKLAGVSHQTVSRVINHSPDVSEVTRAKVQAAIDRLGYRPSNSARALASQRSRTIGLIAGGLRFFGPISAISSIETMARAHELFMSVMLVHEAYCSQKDFEALCDVRRAERGRVHIPGPHRRHVLGRLPCAGAAAVRADHVDAWRGGHPHGHVRDSSRESAQGGSGGHRPVGAMAEVMRLVVEYGHRRALYFAGPQEWRDAGTRLAAWRQLCAEHSVECVVAQCESWESTEAYMRMNHVLEDFGSRGAALPSVVVTANDSQAVGVMRALHEHRLRIPQDVSLVGFDDMPAMDNMLPPLTTVRPDFEQLGVAAMKQVLHLLGEGPEPTFTAALHGVGLVPAKVMLRNSLGPVGR